MIPNQNDWIPKLDSKIGFQNWIPKLDSKMIGIDRGKMTSTTSTMINEVNTMTPRQNDLVVKNWPNLLIKPHF